jgi:hypothetical protein
LAVSEADPGIRLLLMRADFYSIFQVMELAIASDMRTDFYGCMRLFLFLGRGARDCLLRGGHIHAEQGQEPTAMGSRAPRGGKVVPAESPGEIVVMSEITLNNAGNDDSSGSDIVVSGGTGLLERKCKQLWF